MHQGHTWRQETGTCSIKHHWFFFCTKSWRSDIGREQLLNKIVPEIPITASWLLYHHKMAPPYHHKVTDIFTKTGWHLHYYMTLPQGNICIYHMTSTSSSQGDIYMTTKWHLHHHIVTSTSSHFFYTKWHLNHRKVIATLLPVDISPLQSGADITCMANIAYMGTIL